MWLLGFWWLFVLVFGWELAWGLWGGFGRSFAVACCFGCLGEVGLGGWVGWWWGFCLFVLFGWFVFFRCDLVLGVGVFWVGFGGVGGGGGGGGGVFL
ncbi:hypothetical protein RA278_27690, partial [Pseudomonas syringae pv. tagetis]